MIKGKIQLPLSHTPHNHCLFDNAALDMKTMMCVKETPLHCAMFCQLIITYRACVGSILTALHAERNTAANPKPVVELEETKTKSTILIK